MTDLNAGLEFGFLSSLVNISFPGRYALFLCGASDDPMTAAKVVLNQPANPLLLDNGSTFTLIDSTTIIKAGFDQTTGSHWGQTFLAVPGASGQQIPYNWIAIPLRDFFDVVFTNSVITEQIAFVFGCVVNGPIFSTFKFSTVFDPNAFINDVVLSWTGRTGPNSIKYGPAQIGQLALTGNDINSTALNIGFFWQFVFPASSTFTVAVTASGGVLNGPTMTFTPDQGFYD